MLGLWVGDGYFPSVARLAGNVLKIIFGICEKICVKQIKKAESIVRALLQIFGLIDRSFFL
jgi:hypothetical protein